MLRGSFFKFSAFCFAFIVRKMSDSTMAETSSEGVCYAKRNCSGRVKVLAFDFDKTCTTRAVLDIYKARHDYQSNVDLLDEEWKKIENMYSSVVEDILRPWRKAMPMPNSFDENGLRNFLEKVGVGDNLAITELINSNILVGITTAGLKDFAQDVELMPGLLNILQSFKALNVQFHVISLNFSEKLIHTVLSRGGSLPLVIHTNKLLFKNGFCTGSLERNFVSAFDKEIQFQKVIEEASYRNGVTIYIGDSYTDLLALLMADVGIIIGQSQSMLKACNDFGIKILPLHEKNNLNQANENHKFLFSVTTWNEIQQFIQNEI